MIALVAAMDEARLIGVGGRLPWHLPADLARFRALTLGKVVVMGRKTYESIGHPLEGRINVVVRQRAETDEFRPVVAMGEALDTDVFIIGGASVYAQTLPLADVLYLTRVHHTFAAGDGAVYFPAWEGFRCVASEERAADAANPWAMAFEEWRR